MDFGYEKNGYGIKLTEYLGNDKEVVIPTMIDDHVVNGIAEGTFSNNSNIVKVTIPGTVVSLEMYSFNNCPNLKEIVLPNDINLYWNSIFDESDNVTLNVANGSEAIYYAKKHNLKYVERERIDFKNLENQLEKPDKNGQSVEEYEAYLKQFYQDHKDEYPVDFDFQAVDSLAYTRPPYPHELSNGLDWGVKYYQNIYSPYLLRKMRKNPEPIQIEAPRFIDKDEDIASYELYLQDYYKNNNIIIDQDILNRSLDLTELPYPHEYLENYKNGKISLKNKDGLPVEIHMSSEDADKFANYYENNYKFYIVFEDKIRNKNHKVPISKSLNSLIEHLDYMKNNEFIDNDNIYKIDRLKELLTDNNDLDPNNCLDITVSTNYPFTSYNNIFIANDIFRFTVSADYIYEIRELLNDLGFYFTDIYTAYPDEPFVNESVESYERYLTSFYKIINPKYLSKNSSLTEVRDPYPHELKGKYLQYYNDRYLRYVEAKKISNKKPISQNLKYLEKNKYVLDLIDSEKEKLRHIIAATANATDISELNKKAADLDELKGYLVYADDAEVTDLMGLTVENKNVARVHELIKILKFDELGIIGIPKPRAYDENNDNVQSYEKYLLEHYNKYDDDYIETDDPINNTRNRYPHEKISYNENNVPERVNLLDDEYYRDIYLMFRDKLENTQQQTESNKGLLRRFKFGRRKVEKREKLRNNKGILNSIYRQLSKFNRMFTNDDFVKNLCHVGKLILLVCAAIPILYYGAPLVLSFGVDIVKEVGAVFSLLTGIGGPMAPASSIVKILSSLGTIAGIMGGLAIYKKFKDFAKIRDGSPIEQIEAQPVPPLPEQPEQPEQPISPEQPEQPEQEEIDLENANFNSIINESITEYMNAKRQNNALKALEEEGFEVDEEQKKQYDYLEQKTKEQLTEKLMLAIGCERGLAL